MGALDLPREADSSADTSGSEMSLSRGVGPWADDLIAAGVLVILASVLASRAYRWARAQADHPRQLMEHVVAQAKGAGSAAVQGWRGGNGAGESPGSDGDGGDAGDTGSHISVGSPPVG